MSARNRRLIWQVGLGSVVWAPLAYIWGPKWFPLMRPWLAVAMALVFWFIVVVATHTHFYLRRPDLDREKVAQIVVGLITVTMGAAAVWILVGR